MAGVKCTRWLYVGLGAALFVMASVMFYGAPRGWNVGWIGWVTLPGVVLWAAAAIAAYVTQRRAVKRRAGVTLVELLVVMAVMAILATLLGAGAHAWQTRAAREGAAESLQSMLRAARMSAATGGRGAVVRINQQERSLYGLSASIEGAWHFERLDGDVVPGAKGYNGTRTGAGVTDGHDGAVGLCLHVTDGDYVDCGTPPVFTQTDGVRLEAWVNPPQATPGGVVVGDLLGIMGKSTTGPDGGYAVGLRCETPEMYSVRGGFYLEDGTAIALCGAPGQRIRGDEWSHVAIEFDGYEARLFVNGALADLDSYRPQETGNLDPVDDNPAGDPNAGHDLAAGHSDWAFTPPLRIAPARNASLVVGAALYPSGGLRSFEGYIDEPMLLCIAGGSRLYMRPGVSLVASEQAIHFDNAGFLDIAYHSAPVWVAVGDPYQAALLASDLNAGDTTLTLNVASVFPETGGRVIVGAALLAYTGSAGLQLTGLSGVPAGGIAAGAEVQWARTLSISMSGIIARAQ